MSSYPLRPSYTRGFSLLEMLIVIGVLAIVASMTLVMIRGFGTAQHVSVVAETIRADLGEMRTRARSGEGRESFGVAFSSTTYSLISVATPAATTTIRTEQIPQGFTVTAMPAVILFAPISGTAQPAVISLEGRDNATTSITVDAGGSIR